jgi:hypothetical protein
VCEVPSQGADQHKQVIHEHHGRLAQEHGSKDATAETREQYEAVAVQPVQLSACCILLRAHYQHNRSGDLSGKKDNNRNNNNTNMTHAPHVFKSLTHTHTITRSLTHPWWQHERRDRTPPAPYHTRRRT